MRLYHHNKEDLRRIKEIGFPPEKDIQNLFEQNLSDITELSLVKSECTIKNRRIDTLAYDNENNAFCIIEYKVKKNESVVDQGLTYLSLMLENKADFILTYNETLDKNLKRKDVDWSQTRVIFVAPHFTQYQIGATNFKDIVRKLPDKN